MDPSYEIEVTCTCEVFPLLYSPITVATYDYASNHDQLFNVEIICENWIWQVPSLEYNMHTTTQVFSNIPKEEIEQLSNIIPIDFDVPEGSRSSMAAKILDCARNMADNTHKNHKILNMVVRIGCHTWIYTDESDDDDDDEAVQESLEDQGNLLIPASESFIQGLETARVEQEGDCSICLEDYEDDAEGVRLPCSHLFHRICIVNWLRRGSVCPLCRLQMPTGDN